ncbi:hypothetical protein QOZ80_4BG0359820 [Eleusine coracana subsp. coracana]|nr:hypothetical protein QOZ80_4BG0359820 [Eleusine coracana subsp. coracana]
MAMVVETFIPNFISLLTQIAAREESAVRRFVDVREEFERTLVELKNFNADIVWRSTDGTVTASLRDIKDVLYNAADMDIFQLKYDKRRGGCYAFSHRMLQTPRDMKSLHTVLLLNKKLKHIIGQSERYRFTSYINPYEDRRVGHHASRMKHSSIVQLSDVVGVQIEETMWGLLDIMLREIENPGANIKIIAIVGAAGIGKSTLAKKIFDSKICHNHFDLPIWLNVTRSFDNVDLLKSILRSSYDNMGSYGSVDIPHLVTKIGEFIHGRRVLLVLDDVWSSTLWNDLLRAIFSHSRCGGTVILVTTRNTQVAADMEATHVHKVEKLNTEAAWSLLKKKVTLGDKDEPQIDRLREIGIEIVQKYGMINYDKVIHMLMAEGLFLLDGGSELPEALGLEYFRQDEALLVEDGKIITTSLPKLLRRVSVSNKGAEYSDLQTHKSIRALISFGNMVIKPSDSLSTLPHLRILHMNKTKIGTLVDSLHQLKLLSYLDLSNTDVSELPHGIGKMKSLQYISLHHCPNLAHLPRSIVNLERLRYLDISETRVMTVPRYFERLVNLVSLKGFPAYVDDTAKGWCTIEELGPLDQLMHLTIKGLENISSSSSSTCVKLAEKRHLKSLWICCTSSDAYEQHNQEVFDELRPSPSLEDLTITGYFGRHLPVWLSPSTLENLRWLKLENLRSCTQLPCSFGQLPNLESLCIKHALTIRRIGEEFLVPSSALVSDSDEEEVESLISRHFDSVTASIIVFPKLRKLVFYGMLEWKEWEWDAQLEAMHALENVQISRCRLGRLPPGLACQATALREITIEKVKDLISLENFSSVVELYLHSVSNLEKIANLPKMKKLKISKCPKLKELEAVHALSSIELKDQEMSTLPAYLQVLQLSQLQIACNLRLLHFISLKDAALEWDKIKHIEQVEAYADGYQQTKRCSVLYTKMTGSFVAYMSDTPESGALDEEEPESSSEQPE